MADKYAKQNADTMQMLYEQTWPIVEVTETHFSEADLLTWEEKARIIRFGWAMSQSCLEFVQSWQLNAVNYEGSYSFWSAERRMKAVGFQLASKHQLATKMTEVWKYRASVLGVSLPEQHGDLEIALLADAELFDLYRFKAEGKYTNPEFKTRLKEVCERFNVTEPDLEKFKSVRNIS